VAQVNDELLEWEDVKGRYEHSGLLIGNGASLAVWNRFGYGSLYEKAPLDSADKAVFAAAETTNFELVLDTLRLGEVACKAVGHHSEDVRDRYLSVRGALFEAVRRVHVPWDLVPETTFTKIGREFRRYDVIFSTNYDLLAYWSIVFAAAADIRDYFWNADLAFDLTNTEVRGTVSTLLYLHGGIHLYIDNRTGETIKRSRASDNLLNFADLSRRTRKPLFVSEGRSRDKMKSIRRSDYLSFGYQSLVDYEGPLVISGHSLSDADEHIAQAIRSRVNRRVAVGLMPGSALKIIANKTRIDQVLDGQRIAYFDSTTHPLGDPMLEITP
jgi:hypothetical protein